MIDIKEINAVRINNNAHFVEPLLSLSTIYMWEGSTELIEYLLCPSCTDYILKVSNWSLKVWVYCINKTISDGVSIECYL